MRSLERMMMMAPEGEEAGQGGRQWRRCNLTNTLSFFPFIEKPSAEAFKEQNKCLKKVKKTNPVWSMLLYLIQSAVW